MIATIIAAVIGMLVLVAGMAIGVIFANKPIKGSCGGLNALGMKEGCEICGGDADKCETSSKQQASGKKAAALSYDANQRKF